MAESLTEKICTPCQGGIPPMAKNEAEEYAAGTPGWELKDQEKRIERRFTFGDFQDALDFVNKAGAIAEAEGHHPDIEFGWGYCVISIHTHKINGLHENDFILAAKINQLPT